MSVPEERQITQRIKEDIKNGTYVAGIYIMSRNGHVLYIGDYPNMVKAGKVNPQDAYVYIGAELMTLETVFYYPFLQWYSFLLRVFLSKLGFYNSENGIVPAIGLKYVAFAEGYRDYLSIELVNLDVVANNTNLRKIVFEVLGDKIISGEKVLTEEEYRKILGIYRSQKLFAGQDVGDAWDILYNYYHEGNQSLAKEVARIAIDYDRVLHPYRVCYETETWKEIDCSTVKPG